MLVSEKKRVLRFFIISLTIAFVIHLAVIVVLSKTSLFYFFDYFDKVIVAHLSYEERQQEVKKTLQDLNTEEPVESQTEIKEGVVSDEVVMQGNVDEEEKSILTNLEVDLPDIRLEVPRFHDNIIKEALISEKESDKVVLRYRRESLDYDLYWIGMYVGSARLQADTKDNELTITSEVYSSRIISNFYKVQDYAKSTLLNGKPHNFRIKQHEGKYRSDKETFFDYNEGTITFVDYLKNKQFEHAVKDGIHWDVISGFYYLRTMPVINTDKIYVNVFDSNKFVKVQIMIVGREKIEMRNGDEIDTIKAKVILHSEGLFQKVGDIFIWLKDDEYRIPLKVETKVPVGKVTAELRKRDVMK